MFPTVMEIRFNVVGKSLPIDHSYPLYSAISRLLPTTHSTENSWSFLGIHSIFGKWKHGDEDMKITSDSKLLIRTTADTLSEVLKISGQVLFINGRFISLGMPSISPVMPSKALFSRMVTIAGFIDHTSFKGALNRQLQDTPCKVTVGVENKPVVRTKTIKGKRIIGFPVKLEDLSLADSLKVQMFGLGGRRRFGCGIFLPVNNVS